MATFKCGKGVLLLFITSLCVAVAFLVQPMVAQVHLRLSVGKRLGLPKEVAGWLASTSEAPSAVVNAFNKTASAAPPERPSVKMLDLAEAQLVPSTDSTLTSTPTTTQADFGWFKAGRGDRDGSHWPHGHVRGGRNEILSVPKDPQEHLGVEEEDQRHRVRGDARDDLPGSGEIRAGAVQGRSDSFEGCTGLAGTRAYRNSQCKHLPVLQYSRANDHVL